MNVVATAVIIDIGISKFSFPNFKTLKRQEHSYIKLILQTTI